jgi:hypothetical protein
MKIDNQTVEKVAA